MDKQIKVGDFVERLGGGSHRCPTGHRGKAITISGDNIQLDNIEGTFSVYYFKLVENQSIESYSIWN